MGHEAFLAEIEVRSNPCASASEAVAEPAEGRARLRAAGASLIAAGLHPDATYGDVRLVDNDATGEYWFRASRDGLDAEIAHEARLVP